MGWWVGGEGCLAWEWGGCVEGGDVRHSDIEKKKRK